MSCCRRAAAADHEAERREQAEQRAPAEPDRLREPADGLAVGAAAGTPSATARLQPAAPGHGPGMASRLASGAELTVTLPGAVPSPRRPPPAAAASGRTLNGDPATPAATLASAAAPTATATTTADAAPSPSPAASSSSTPSSAVTVVNKRLLSLSPAAAPDTSHPHNNGGAPTPTSPAPLVVSADKNNFCLKKV